MANDDGSDALAPRIQALELTVIHTRLDYCDGNVRGGNLHKIRKLQR